MSIAEGQTLGNYQILSRLGVGGMGAVYLAEHPLIGKKVALKVIHGELASNREVVQRFFNEAKAVNKIGNEHIVEIHDFGQSPEGDHFYIMEYLDGVTLAQLLETDVVLEVGRALHISVQIAAALAAAHAAGIIHRDLKPDNIMVIARQGDPNYVKVLDFGLAKVFVDAGGAKLTAQGVVLGTPQYMSPEACESKQDIDHRSDIYALGILMFQMMTGSLPFDGNTMGEVMVKHVTQPPPAPRAINGEIPPAVEQIILRCLAKRPDARFGTMLALRDALLDPDRYLASSPPIMPSAPQADPSARTMFLDAAARRPSEEQQVVRPPARDFALKPPPPSMIQAPAPAQSREPMAFEATGPQNAIHPAGDAGAGAPAAVSLGALAASADARTAFMDVSAQNLPPLAPAARPLGQPGPAVRPVEAANHTMVIGTPVGHSDAPPAPKWPLVVAGIAVLLVGGGIAAFMLTGEGKTNAAAGDGAAVAVVAPAAVLTDAAVAIDAPTEALLKLRTSPTDAQIFDEAGVLLGRTPTQLRIPLDGAERTFVFRHPKAEDRTKTMVVDGDGEISIELELLQDQPETPATPAGDKTNDTAGQAGDSGKSSGTKSSGTKSSGTKSSGSKTGDGTMQPDF